MDNTLTPSEIAGYADGLRRLAHVLVRDAASADDAVQETLVRALEGPPRRGPTTRAWFGAVLRNTVRRQWRTAERRTTREQAQASPRRATTPVARLEHTEMAQAVVGALAAIAPTQREALELRYFEGRKPAAIAAELGVPVETVKTRIKRGREAIRQVLDSERPGTWVPGFVSAFGIGPEGLAVLGKAGVGIPVLVLGVLLALLGVWLGIEFSTAPDTVTASYADLEVGDADVEAARAGPTLGGRATRKTAGPTAPEIETKASEASAPEVRDVPGRIEILRKDGRPLRIAEASLHVSIGGGPGYGKHRLAVKNGRFTIKLYGTRRPRFRGVDWSGGVARIEVDEAKALDPIPDAYVLTAHAITPTIVHVLDAATGTPLSNVAWARSGREERHRTHPGLGKAKGLTWGASPLRLLPTVDELSGEPVSCRVHVPGYGWDTFAWPGTGERTIRVELTRAGHLRLRTIGPALDVKAHVRVEATDRHEHTWRAEWLLRPNGDHTLRGLPAGAYRARIEVGLWFRDVPVLAEARFTVTPGELREVTLEYEAPKATKPVRVRGTFNYPAAWTRERLYVNLTRMGRSVADENVRRRSLKPGRGLTVDPQDPTRYRMDAGLLQPGRYQVDMMAIGYVGTFIVPEDGSDDLRLDIPPPVKVTLQVVGDVGGLGSFVNDVTWVTPPPKGFRMYSSCSAERTSRDEPFVFLAAAGRIQVRPTGYAYRATEGQFEIEGEAQEIVLAVKPNGMLLVSAHHEGKRLPWEWAWKVEVEAVDHAGVLGARGPSSKHGGYRAFVDRAGRYRVTVQTIPGYEPLPERIVDVGVDKIAEVVYELETRR